MNKEQTARKGPKPKQTIKETREFENKEQTKRKRLAKGTREFEKKKQIARTRPEDLRTRNRTLERKQRV